MEKIADTHLLDFYCNKFDLYSLFSKNIKDHMELFLFNRNELICNHALKLEYVFLFVEGKAKIYNTLSNGKSLLLCFYKPFKILGDLEIFINNAIPFNVQALETCYCIGIHINYVNEYLLQDPKTLKFFCSALSEKLYKLSVNSSINLLYQVENRLASYILATGEKISIDSIDTLIFRENLTYLSELIGTSYRHLLRTINNFCNNNIMKKHKDFYEIIDIKALNKLTKDLYN